MPVKGPAILRPIVQALHWSTLLVIAAVLFDRIPGWVALVHALPWAGITVVSGLRGSPSPALSGWMKRAAHLSHWALLALYLGAAILAAIGSDAARPALLAVMGLGALHGAFNLWRSSVLADGALRRMLPKSML